MTREEIKDFCDMKVQPEPENEDIFKAIVKALEQEPVYTSQIAQKAYEDGKKDGYVQAKLEQGPQTFKWCETCKEYDQEKHCCHRWGKVIRDTVEEMKQESVLDKIRAEIIERDKNIKSVRSDSCCFFTAEEVLEIIDKYKAESEKKE